MTEDWLENRLRRLPGEQVPASPWLEDRTMTMVGMEASKVRAGQVGHSVRFNLAGLAAVIIGALVVGLLVGSRLSAQQVAAPPMRAAPSRDAGILRYRATVDADMRAIDNAFVNGQCDARVTCLATLTRTRTAAEQLRVDMAAMAAPKSVTGIVTEVVAADTQFIAQLDAASAAVRDPSSDYAAAAGVPDIGGLQIAVAELDCWPALPVEGDHGITCS